jgi:hypothetical protein
MNTNDPSSLDTATDAELFAVLGVQALPLVQQPSVTLAEGRNGAFVAEGSDALGVEFQHGYFENIARTFLRNWATQLGRVVCGQGKAYGTLRRRAASQGDVVVGVIAASITQHIPEIAPYTGLVAVLGTLITRTGVDGFCEMLKEIQSHPKLEAIRAADSDTHEQMPSSKSRARKLRARKQINGLPRG